jgi:DNA-binding NarL/FixJ family response regulator
MKSLRKRKYTHLIIDIGLTDGSALDILPHIRALYPDLNIMVYSGKPSGVYERGLWKFGIRHYLSKEEGELETIRRFRLFLSGQEYRQAKEPATDSPFSSLTERQLQVMQHLLDGNSGVEIAQALNVRTSTVSTLKRQLLERTAVKNLMELTELASIFRLP